MADGKTCDVGIEGDWNHIQSPCITMYSETEMKHFNNFIPIYNCLLLNDTDIDIKCDV